jgi:hypothetical protein
MSSVKANKPKAAAAPKRKVRSIHIERAGNGVTISHHREPPAPTKGGMASMMMEKPADPMVFQKMSKAHAHVKDLMGQMSAEQEMGNADGENSPNAEGEA